MKDHRLFGQLVAIRAVDLAVAQFLVVQAHLLGRLAGLLLMPEIALRSFLVLDDLPLENLRRLGVLVQVVVEVLGEESRPRTAQLLTDPRFDLLRTGTWSSSGSRRSGRETLDRNGRDDRRTHVRGVVVLVIELLDRLGDGGAQGRLVRPCVVCWPLTNES